MYEETDLNEIGMEMIIKLEKQMKTKQKTKSKCDLLTWTNTNDI